jgi:hypothetical protein
MGGAVCSCRDGRPLLPGCKEATKSVKCMLTEFLASCLPHTHETLAVMDGAMQCVAADRCTCRAPAERSYSRLYSAGGGGMLSTWYLRSFGVRFPLL